MQAMQCTGPCVTAIRRAGLHHYLEFLPVTSAFVYDRAAARLRRVPACTADVHSAEGLSAAQRRQLWLVMREVERGATGSRTTLFGTGDFEAALRGCGLPQYVEVWLKNGSASISFPFVQRSVCVMSSSSHAGSRHCWLLSSRMRQCAAVLVSAPATL